MAASPVKKFAPIIVSHTGKKCNAAVILMHGSGSTGDALRTTFSMLLRTSGDLAFPHIRVTYPTAPIRPYTLAGGVPSTVWFDRKTLGLEGQDDLESLDVMAVQLQELIDAEVQSGIPLNRIILGGFSMGGCMALHLGYRFLPEVAGVIAMGSFLYGQSAVYKDIEKRPKDLPLPPLLQVHGEEDDLVRFNWGKDTFTKLQNHGVQGEFVPVPNLGHTLNKNIALSVREWILKRLPEEHS
ncbi:hypothetical protein BaRGS_00004478 [Batillaria attramentaria]|uniref:palmitoyl-protein hydrolase n=1 Tax=Batillaria attramentaria TaxID=370345 RepID=A0ABD0LYU6_9CAEN